MATKKTAAKKSTPKSKPVAKATTPKAKATKKPVAVVETPAPAATTEEPLSVFARAEYRNDVLRTAFEVILAKGTVNVRDVKAIFDEKGIHSNVSMKYLRRALLFATKKKGALRPVGPATYALP